MLEEVREKYFGHLKTHSKESYKKKRLLDMENADAVVQNFYLKKKEKKTMDGFPRKLN